MNQKELEEYNKAYEDQSIITQSIIRLENEMLFRKMLVNYLLDWCITNEYYNKCIDNLNKRYEQPSKNI